ncbi:MAG: hypothetical protein HYY93_01770 [Planctomycetes bacterium]|nr:hypothetical protein [Planctomycetota bacterium]
MTTAVPAGAAALRGETISLQMGEGEIRGGSERDLRVSLKASKAEVAVPYSSLRSTELVRLAEAGGATSEARGLFWLFEGSPEEARRAWSASSRRAELDGFAALVEASALDREGRELLRALLAAADKRDWKSCRKILEQRPRLAGAKSWIEASAQIDEIVESSAESVEDPLYAVAPRRKGETLLWSYDFEKPEELRDWRMEAGDIHRTDHCQHPTGYGLRLDQGSLILRNARLNFLAPLVGELRIEADLTLIESEKTPCIYVGVGGYRWTVEQESAMLETPLGKTPGVHGPPLKPGVLHRIALSVDRRGVSVRLDGRVLFSAPVDEALRAGPPSVQLFRNTTIRLDRVVVTGTPRRDWVAAERERRALLAGVGRKYALGAAQILTDGKSLGKFEKGDEGVWEVVDGALRGTGSSPEGNSGLYAPVFRNFRFRMKYRPETARYIDFSPRQGGHAWLGLCLPVAAPAEWHDIEVVAVETAATCVLDGGVMLGLSMSEGVFTEKVRIMIRDGHSSLKDVTLEEIKGAPPDPSVALYDGFELGPVASAPSWTVDAQGKKSWERRLLVGSGDLQSRDSWKDMDVRLRIEGMAKTRIQLLLRGGAVMDWTFPKDGLYTVFVYAKGDSADVYVNDHVHAPARLKASPGPVRLTVSQGIAKVHEFRVRPVR